MKKFNVTVNGTVYEVEVNEVGGAAPVAAPKAAAPAPKTAPASCYQLQQLPQLQCQQVQKQ